MTNDNCRCVGDWCTCRGHAVAKDGAIIHVPLMMRDSAGKSVSIEDAAKSPIYDAYRGLRTDDGVPMDQHMAMIDLERQGAAAQRSEAHRDHMIRELTDARSEPHTAIGDARAKMIADMQAGL